MIGIVDYGLGNLTSVAGAVEKLGWQPRVTRDAAELETCEKLILPGVGAFGDAMRRLGELDLIAVLDRLVADRFKPILGICLGAQLMTRESDEFGHQEGLGWVDARVTRLAPADPSLRVPHVGWNEFHRSAQSRLFVEVPDDALFYYVHSYGIQADDGDIVVGTCDYGGSFVAAFARGNVYGTQFHPEKSQLHGLAVLRNFLERG